MKLLFEASALIPLYQGVLNDRSMGGTETALIKISDELSSLGVSVDIRTSLESNEHASGNAGGNPRYLPKSSAVNFSQYNAIIVIQNWRIIPYLPRLPLYLWTGDGAEQYSNFGIGDVRVYERLKGLIVTTAFHKESLCKSSGFPIHKCHVIGNGFSDFFVNKEHANRSGMIFHSAPYRGLEHVLRYVRELRANQVMESLQIFSDMELYKRGSAYSGPHAEVIHLLKAQFQNISDVSFNSTVPQVELASHLKKAKVFPYPCIVPEVFCMSMLEAMAAGVVPLVSNIGGLAEVLNDEDLIIDGKPGEKIFDQEFLMRLRRLLTDEAYRVEKAKIAQSRALMNYTWKIQAKNFLNVIS